MPHLASSLCTETKTHTQLKLLQTYSDLLVFVPGSDTRMVNLAQEGLYFYSSQYL